MVIELLKKAIFQGPLYLSITCLIWLTSKSHNYFWLTILSIIFALAQWGLYKYLKDKINVEIIHKKKTRAEKYKEWDDQPKSKLDWTIFATILCGDIVFTVLTIRGILAHWYLDAAKVFLFVLSIAIVGKIITMCQLKRG